MPNKAEIAAVQKIAKAIGKGYTLTPAQPSGAYDRLAPKDGRTVCWVMPRGSYVRVMFVADVTGARKGLLKDTTVTKGRVYLRVTEANVEQARSLIAFAVEHAPEKPHPVAVGKTASSGSRPTARRTPPVKKKVSFRLGDRIRTEKVNERDVTEFVASLEAQGATEIRVA